MSNIPHTRLSGKEFSPMILRRYSTPVLHWIGIISDDNLDDVDSLVREFWEEYKDNGVVKAESIQEWRNLTGELLSTIDMHYEKIEGCAVIISADKMLISSLLGDFMNHEQCRLELYSLLNLSTQI